MKLLRACRKDDVTVVSWRIICCFTWALVSLMLLQSCSWDEVCVAMVLDFGKLRFEQRAEFVLLTSNGLLVPAC